jgi:hypothetical protein
MTAWFLTLSVIVDLVLFWSGNDIRIFFLKFIATFDLSLMSFCPHIENWAAGGLLVGRSLGFEDVDGLLDFDEVINHLVHEHLNDLFRLAFSEAIC